MARMKVSRNEFLRCIMKSRVRTSEGVRVDPEKLSRLSGVALGGAKARLKQWRDKYIDAGITPPFPPAMSEGRGAKKLNLAELAAIAAEFDDLDDLDDFDDDDDEGGDE